MGFINTSIVIVKELRFFLYFFKIKFKRPVLFGNFSNFSAFKKKIGFRELN